MRSSVMNLKKLKNMSPGEVGYRLKMAGTKKLAKVTHKRPEGLLAPGRFLPTFELPSDHQGPFADAVANGRWRAAEEYLLEHMRARVKGSGYHRAQPRFFFSGNDRPEITALIKQHLPGVLSQTLSEAEKLLNHKFSFFGVSNDFPGEIDWHRDPLSLESWPRKFYTELKFYGQADGDRRLPGDVKHVWELNRHQHFAVLGKAYWLTNDDNYSNEFFAQCTSWIAQNPFLYGVNWTSALEAGLRALSWIWGYFFCLDANALEARLHAQFLRVLQLHGQYVNRHLSFFTSPYNHLIGEAVALFFLGTLFPEFREASHWREKGWTLLVTEATKQFHHDGMSVEQAISYHHFTLGLYLLAAILAQRNGVALPHEMRERLERAAEFSQWSVQPDGRHPMIGDNDDATAFYFGKRAAWDFRQILALSALLFHRGDLKAAAGEYDEACLWLLGPESHQRFQTLEGAGAAPRSRLFAESGYAILRGDERHDQQYLIFDCGPQSHGLHSDEIVSTAHGHADALSFTLCAHGAPLLIDSGMWCYNGELNWQNHFRSGMAHNTITVDGRSACRIVGRLGYSHVPVVAQSVYISQTDYTFVEATYVGFECALRHRRGIFYRHGDYWLIIDRLAGDGEHEIDRWFHFAPEAELRRQSQQIIMRRADHKNLVLQDLNAPQVVAEIFQGGAQADQGWIAPGYGRTLAAPVLRLRSQRRMPAQFVTVLMPCGSEAPALDWEYSGTQEGANAGPFELRLSTHGWTDRIVFNFDEAPARANTGAIIIYHRHEPEARGNESMASSHMKRMANWDVFENLKS